MNVAVLPDYSSTRVVAFVVAVFFEPSPSSKVMVVAMASGQSFAAYLRPFWRFCINCVTISSFQHYAGQGKNEHKGHEGQRQAVRKHSVCSCLFLIEWNLVSR